jgi:HAMP domain-containing protein
VVVGQDEVEADKVIRELAARVEQARTALSDYRAIRRATHASDEFGEGFQVAQVLEAMQAAFGQLDQAVARLAQTQIRQPGRSLLEDERLLAAHEQLLAQSNLLWKGIFDEMYWQFDVSKRQARKSLTVVLTASGAALVLVSVLLYYFSRWIFHPIEQLQAGVKRVRRRRLRASHRATLPRRVGRVGHRLQRHDCPAARDLPRPGPASQRALAATGALRAAGVGRLPGGGGGARDQQSAGLDCLLCRGAGTPAWPT